MAIPSMSSACRTRNRTEQRMKLQFAAVLMMALSSAAMAADPQFSTPLDPVAFDKSTVKNNVGSGNVTATLSGSTLTITGNYAGLSSEATGAQVKLGPVMGVPGNVIGTLKVSGGMQGQVSGSIRLNSA